MTAEASSQQPKPPSENAELANPPPRNAGRMLKAALGSPTGSLALCALVLLAAIAIYAPIRYGRGVVPSFNVAAANQGPSSRHLLGTDDLGRDVLQRTLVASRLSLQLAAEATVLASVVGYAIGMALGIVGQAARTFGSRIIELMLAFPAILLALFIGAIFGPGPRTAVLSIGIAFTPGLARLSSKLAVVIGSQEYISAARVLGVRRRRLVTRYVLPNAAETMVIFTSFAMGSALIAVSSLSFLGLGVQAPSFDWGSMLADGIKSFYVNPAQALAPAVAIALAGLSFGLAGEALARALDPRTWTESGNRRRRRLGAPSIGVGIAGAIGEPDATKEGEA
jgi:peptide/nickel transport system permease protein